VKEAATQATTFPSTSLNSKVVVYDPEGANPGI